MWLSVNAIDDVTGGLTDHVFIFITSDMVNYMLVKAKCYYI